MREEFDTGLVTRGAAHLAQNGLGYFGHMAVALRIAARLFGATLACLCHGIVPGAFTTTASRTIRSLHQELDRGHAASAAGPARAAEAEA
jgi:hypothetical protein